MLTSRRCREWVDAYKASEWPLPPLALPSSGSLSLDRKLERAARVWDSVVRLFRSHAPSRDELMRAWRERSEEDRDPLVQTLASIESDYYVLQLASVILAAADARVRMRDADDLAAELRDFLDAHPFVGDPDEVLARSLLDILDLPLWKRRNELYAAWVLAELLASARAETRLIPSEPGVLQFPFRLTRMAELVGCEHEVAVWSEVRTPLVDPLGTSRQAGVQPDYTVLVDVAAPEPEASVLEIECKQ